MSFSVCRKIQTLGNTAQKASSRWSPSCRSDIITGQRELLLDERPSIQNMLEFIMCKPPVKFA